MKHMEDINITSLLLLPISIIYGLSIFLYNLLAISYKSKLGWCVLVILQWVAQVKHQL